MLQSRLIGWVVEVGKIPMLTAWEHKMFTIIIGLSLDVDMDTVYKSQTGAYSHADMRWTQNYVATGRVCSCCILFCYILYEKADNLWMCSLAWNVIRLLLYLFILWFPSVDFTVHLSMRGTMSLSFLIRQYHHQETMCWQQRYSHHATR